MGDVIARGLAKKNADNIEVLNRVKVSVEKYKRQGSETDDTDRIMRAIADAPEGSEITCDPDKTYTWTNLVIEKSIRLNGNGAKAIVDPTSSGVSGDPAIWFKGSVGTTYNIPATINEKAIQITLDTGHGVNFAKDDYVVIGDSKVINSWDGTGYNYTGRWEINMITSVSGDVITLVNPLEWTYDTTPTIRKVTNMLKQPAVFGFSSITEVDPGSNSPTANAGDPHIIQFEYCLQPEVERCIFDKWQLHAINFYRCVFPQARYNQAYDPFRPSYGGHGYVIKVDNCFGGLFEANYARHARHVVDWSRSYGGLSFNNESYYPYGVSYYTHGLGSKRARSMNDTVTGKDANSEGWAMGNQDFNQDIDFQIINLKYRGEGIAVGMKTMSKGMKVINPDIVTKAKYAIGVSRGAEDFELIGGTVENNDTGGLIYGLLARANTTDGATGGVDVKNITVKGTKFKGNAMVLIDALGKIDVSCEMDVTLGTVYNPPTETSTNGAVRISPSVAATDVLIRDCFVVGTFERGIYLSTAPTRFYDVSKNKLAGQTVTGYQLRADSKLRMQDNDCIDSGNGATLVAFSSDIVAAKAAGAIVKNNRPNTYDS